MGAQRLALTLMTLLLLCVKRSLCQDIGYGDNVPEVVEMSESLFDVIKSSFPNNYYFSTPVIKCCVLLSQTKIWYMRLYSGDQCQG
jgi:hypothetical protein